MILPCMKGWKAQWYEYVPALVKVKENVPPPELIVLESQVTAEPLSLVEVWGTPESLTHMMVAPTLIVTVAGWKANEPAAPVILMVVVLAALAEVAVGCAGAVVAVGATLELPPVEEVAPVVEPHPASAIRPKSAHTNMPVVSILVASLMYCLIEILAILRLVMRRPTARTAMIGYVNGLQRDA